MATTRIQWDTTPNKDAIRGGIRKVFDTTERAPLTESSALYNMISTNEYITRDLRVAQLDYPGSVAEGAQIPIQDPKFGQKLDYTQRTWGTGFRITMHMKQYNQIGEMKRLTASLKMVMREGKDVELAKVWVTPTATYTGFTSIHLGEALQTTLSDAGTKYSNVGQSALSTTSLETAYYYFDTLIDDVGNISPKRPDMLVHHPLLQWTATELFKSANMPHEQSNTINPYADLQTYNYHRLTSDTSWFMLARKDPQYDINCFTSKEPDFEFEGPFDTTRDTLVTSAQSYEFGFGDPRCVYVGKT